jgi:hypothetical protein
MRFRILGKIKTAKLPKKAVGEENALPPVVEDALKAVTNKILTDLGNSGWWTHEGLEIVEEYLLDALTGAAANVFEDVEKQGHYPKMD